MRSLHLYLSSFLLHNFISAIPISGHGAAGNLALHRRGIKVARTTAAADGSIIDWIDLHSQVDDAIAVAPPLPVGVLEASNQTTYTPISLLQEAGAPTGPAGTVPVLRTSTTAPSVKGPPVDPDHVPKLPVRAAGDHWYASSAQTVENHGGSGSFSLYKAYTQSSNDFSLLQSATIRYNVPKPGDNSQLVTQTVEAGWINYPAQGASPHLFTFYTTDGYATIADNKGGWNRDVAGWVQVDTQIFPGTSFSTLSTRGGTQYDMKIQTLLYQGNWWIYVLDRWIGYYPASLFSANTDAGRSLATEASAINFYGEIYDSHPQLTTTDMGSGNWPEAGWQQSAYIRNMVYTDTSGNDQRYDGSRGVIISDSNRYRMDAEFGSATTWASYMYLGGPGAGGVIDG